MRPWCLRERRKVFYKGTRRSRCDTTLLRHAVAATTVDIADGHQLPTAAADPAPRPSSPCRRVLHWPCRPLRRLLFVVVSLLLPPCLALVVTCRRNHAHVTDSRLAAVPPPHHAPLTRRATSTSPCAMTAFSAVHGPHACTPAAMPLRDAGQRHARPAHDRPSACCA